MAHWCLQLLEYNALEIKLGCILSLSSSALQDTIIISKSNRRKEPAFGSPAPGFWETLPLPRKIGVTAERLETLQIMLACGCSHRYPDIPSAVFSKITSPTGNFWESFYPEKTKRTIASKNFMQMEILNRGTPYFEGIKGSS